MDFILLFLMLTIVCAVQPQRGDRCPTDLSESQNPRIPESQNAQKTQTNPSSFSVFSVLCAFSDSDNPTILTIPLYLQCLQRPLCLQWFRQIPSSLILLILSSWKSWFRHSPLPSASSVPSAIQTIPQFWQLKT